MSRETLIGVAAVVVAITVAGVANLAGQVATLGEVLILIGFLILVSAVVFGLVIPWAKRAMDSGASNRPAKTGIVLSILGFVTVVAFWSGLPVILGAGGAALGQIGRERAANVGRGGLSLAALIIGIIAAVGAAGILVLERLGI
jgi:quinol-cytochrome oxidoreductase complex cytochrome b subunit